MSLEMGETQNSEPTNDAHRFSQAAWHLQYALQQKGHMTENTYCPTQSNWCVLQRSKFRDIRFDWQCSFHQWQSNKIKWNDFIDTDHKEYNYQLTSEDKLIEELILNFWTENNAIQAVSKKYLQSIEPLHTVRNPNSYKWHSQIHHSVSATYI